MVKDKQLRSIAQVAREDFRCLKNSVAGVTVQRAVASMSAANVSAQDIIDSFVDEESAQTYASGSKAVKKTALVASLECHREDGSRDPFAEGRGMVAIALAVIAHGAPATA